MNSQDSVEPLIKQEEENSCWRCFFIFIKCLLTSSIWGLMIWLIIIKKEDKNTDPLIPILGMIISYVLYFIFEIYSPTLSLLRSIKDKEFKDVISDFIQAAPDINFTCFDEIYNGHKIASHKFPYKFCMDISKNDDFNLEEERKYFVKLIINREILPNDDETRDDFKQKEKEYSQEIENGKRWVDVSFFGLKNICLIRIKNKCCLFSNCFVYIIFIFLSLGEFYELILWCITVEKKITIKKIITIKDEFKIPVSITNISQNPNENDCKNSENEIILHNNGKKLKFKNNIGKYIFKNNTLKTDQNENESNRSFERDNSSKNSTINIPYVNQ